MGYLQAERWLTKTASGRRGKICATNCKPLKNKTNYFRQPQKTDLSNKD